MGKTGEVVMTRYAKHENSGPVPYPDGSGRFLREGDVAEGDGWKPYVALGYVVEMKNAIKSSSSTKIAPVETAPVEAAPVEAAPVEAAPVEALPAVSVGADEGQGTGDEQSASVSYDPVVAQKGRRRKSGVSRD